MTLRRRGYLLEQRNLKAHKSTTSRREGKHSAPFQVLVKKDLLQGRVLDYGCGKGVDADRLSIQKYDPHYFPEKPEGEYDTIICNYVLNVVKPKRGAEILAKIRKLLKPGGNAYITVRSDVKEDGFTSKGTYQRDVQLKLPVIARGGWYRMYQLKG